MIKKREAYIGIDIGSSYIKAVLIEKSVTGELVLSKANIVESKEGIRKAVSGMALKRAKVIVSVNCQTACARYITVPVMSQKELPEAIKWEVNNRLSLSPEEFTIEYKLEGEVDEAQVKKFKIKLAVLSTKTINDTLQLLSQAGIEPVSIISSSLAVERITEYMHLNENEITAVIDIGSQFTEIIIVKDGLLRFQRKIAFGGAAITKAMTAILASGQGRLELNFEEAEKIKIEYGIPKEAGLSLIEGKATSSQLISLMRPIMERLVREIERSFEYYNQEMPVDKIKKVILSGGGSELGGLVDFLQRSLDIPVSLFTQLKGVDAKKNTSGGVREAVLSRMTMAIGAALSEGKGINFLPIKLKQKKIQVFKHTVIESAVACVVVVLILVMIGIKFQLAMHEEKIRYGNEILRKMTPRLEIASNYERLNKELSQKKAFIDAIIGGTPDWGEAFKELSNKIPADAVLTEMRMDGGALFIKGKITGAVENKEEALSGLISNLEGGIFKNVSLLSATMGEAEKSKPEFEIKCAF